MAEALYPTESPPPSYESQFQQYKARLGETSPLPSAPPLRHPRMSHPKPRSHSDPHAPALAKLSSMNKQKSSGLIVSKKKCSSGGEKEDLAAKSGPKRVPQRLAPPPPFQRGNSSVHPQAKPGSRTRPFSSIEPDASFSQSQGENFGNFAVDARAELRGNVSRESSVSTSMYDIAEHSEIDDTYRPQSAMLSTSSHRPMAHTYDYIEAFRPQNPMETSLEEGGERVVYAVPIRRRQLAQFNRQASAPANVHFQQGGARTSLTDSLGGVMYRPQMSLPEGSPEASHIYQQPHMTEPHPSQAASPPVHYFVDPQYATPSQMPSVPMRRKNPYSRPIHVLQDPPHSSGSGAQPLWILDPNNQTSAEAFPTQSVPINSQAQSPPVSVPLDRPMTCPVDLSPPQSASMTPAVPQTTDYRPMPKPRSYSQGANQLALVPVSAQQQQQQQQQQPPLHYHTQNQLALVPANTQQQQQQLQQQQQQQQQHKQLQPQQHQPSPLSLSHVAPNTTHQQQNVASTTQQQQVSSSQLMGAIPGMSQLHTYSYTQQSSMVTIPEIPQQPQPQMVLGIPHSLSTPLIAGIPQGIPNSLTVPAQLNVQVLSQNQNTLQQETVGHQLQPGQQMVQAESMAVQGGSESAFPNENQASLVEAMETVEVVSSEPTDAATPMTSPQREPRRPVPIPRNMRRTSNLEFDQGALSGGEGSEVGRQSDSGPVGSTVVTSGDDEPKEQAAPAKPPRRHARKPAPPPPASASDAAVRELITGVEGEQPRVTEVQAAVAPAPPAEQDLVTPTGYKIRDIFSNGNVIVLLPLSDPLRLPVRASSSSVRGRGAFKNDCKFEVVFLSSAMGHEQTVLVVMLKSFSRMNRYLTINSKGKLKMSKGATEKSKFVVRHVSERPLLRYGVVTLESAIHPDWFVSLSASGKPRNSKVPRTAVRLDESRFAVRVERIFNAYSSTLRSFDKPSVMNQIHDRNIIQLESLVTSRYLCITMKGKLKDTGNKGDITTHFMFFDRGMGVVSLRSSKKQKYWLRVKEGRVHGNGKPDLAADFRLLEAPDGSVLFESIITPGIFLHPPCDGTDATTANKNFKIKLISK